MSHQLVPVDDVFDLSAAPQAFEEDDCDLRTDAEATPDVTDMSAPGTTTSSAPEGFLVLGFGFWFWVLGFAFGCLGVPVFGCLGVWGVGCMWFGCLGVWVFGCSGFRCSAFRCLGV